jgi:hypothetical protein
MGWVWCRNCNFLNPIDKVKRKLPIKSITIPNLIPAERCPLYDDADL